ncbi:MAG TPA: D-alanyl-D-alanine carboxypeptidase [Bacteroidales bacterium]|nr:D-alanyl-D-alanine carboxypeptidase [Bacteroidales bacterium]HPS16316.1 D-alanyl-D-alanine carboxypeptidase [Bacteroidales bacterium]
MKPQNKWIPYFWGIMAGIWLLAAVEAIYFYSKFLKDRTKTEQQKKETEAKIIPLSALDSLKYYVDELATHDSISHGTFGFFVATADSGKIIYERNSDISLIPASSLKVVTTGIALKTLGKDFYFPTILQYSGVIDKNSKTLRGNIYIHGSGDPTLGSNNFGVNAMEITLRQWLTAIDSLGIDSINGSIIGDGEIYDYDATPGGWAWEDVVNNYGAAPSGLSFHDNCYDIKVTITKYGVKSEIEPDVPQFTTQNNILYNPFIYNSYVYAAGPPFVNERIVRGEVKYNGVYSCPVPDPAYFCAYTLYKYLKKNKINVSDSATTIRKLNLKGYYEKPLRKPVLITYSPSLTNIAYFTLHVSDNMYAETFLKEISVAKNKFGNTLGGINAIYDYWSDKNIDLRGFYMTDGSGLSRNNNITAKQLTYMLVSFANDSDIFVPLYKCMPIVGENYYNKDSDSTSIFRYNIHAKSGYMSRVRSYTGYCRNKKGKMLAFTMIANNHEFAWNTLLHRMYRIMKIITELE